MTSVVPLTRDIPCSKPPYPGNSVPVQGKDRLMSRLRQAVCLVVVMLAAIGVFATPGAANSTICIGYTQCETHGYNRNQSYWGAFSGANCTNYASYMLQRNQVPRPGSPMGNAWEWKRWRTPDDVSAVGAIAWWDRSPSRPNGHVAYVEEVRAGGNTITISEDNYGGDFYWKTLDRGTADWPDGFLHFRDIPPPASGTPPGSPGAIAALEHGSRVNLRWGAAPNATDYQIFRGSHLLGTTSSPTYLDVKVSPDQAYRYTVVARNAHGSSSAASAYVQTNVQSGDRAYLSTKDGPAVCGRAGTQASQFLVCNVLKPSGWYTRYSSPGDWGYAADRSWVSNADGSVSY
ncbi:CHAP domain-containing protein, partial [Streptosporangium sp. NPDC023615]|uniref:CHAP domain-containing protein n=1 Tax=Streptosporangium sp. NPDC023615 TaxID=3154794 RepID=UPI00341BE7AB